MKTKLLIFALIIVAILVISVGANQLYLFPTFPSSESSSGLCVPDLNPSRSLSSLVNKSEVILTGTAVGHKWNIKTMGTQTKISVDDVIKGSLSSNEIIIVWNTGSSVSERFDKGEKYLFFLPNPDTDKKYYGFSSCDNARQKYPIIIDNFGNETVRSFRKDIENLIEEEIECPGGSAPIATTIDIAGKKTVNKPAPCVKKYVLLKNLINQIKQLDSATTQKR